VTGREPPGDRLARAAHVNVLIAGNRFADDMERVCRTEGISHAQYVTLWVLCLADDVDAGLPMRELADGLLNRASDTTRLVDRLVAGGLAERGPDPTDRRVVRVRSTPEGQALFARLAPKVRDLHAQEWQGLTTAELTELHRLLAKALWSGGDDGPPALG